MSQKLEHLLFLRRTWVWIPAPHSSSQLPITLDLEDLIPSSDFLAYLYSHGAYITLSRVPPLSRPIHPSQTFKKRNEALGKGDVSKNGCGLLACFWVEGHHSYSWIIRIFILFYFVASVFSSLLTLGLWTVFFTPKP